MASLSRSSTICFIFFLLFPRSCSTFVHDTYREVTSSSTGGSLCATDNPSSTVALPVEYSSECGFRCAISRCCFFYQFRFDSGKCELYDVQPANLQPDSSCRAFISVVNALQCPVGFIPACRSCYSVSATGMSWQAAANFCQSLIPYRSHLVIVEDAVKQRQLDAMMPIDGCTAMWTSGRRIENGTSFVWDPFPATNGSGTLSMTFAYWGSGQPALANGDCVIASVNFWYNFNCLGPHACALCELD